MCIIIEHPKNIKFDDSKMNDTSIWFSYNNRHYVLFRNKFVGNPEIILYEKKKPDSRKLTMLKSIKDTGDFDDYLIYTCDPQNSHVYVNKEAFVRRLVYRGFAYNADYSDQCAELSVHIRSNNRNISFLQELIRQISEENHSMIEDFVNNGVVLNANNRFSLRKEGS